MKLLISEVIDKIEGELLKGSSNDYFGRLIQDSREIKEGDTFVAYKGENMDGHTFISSAVSNGAKTIIVTKKDINLEEIPVTVVYVKDHRKALEIIASEMLKQSDVIRIGITGSVGKTSTREAIAEVLRQKYSVYETEKNYNGVIGLPMTASKIEDEDVAVLEMGTNGKGQMNTLSNIVTPDIGIITNIGSSHIGIFGSRENILKEKMDIIAGMKIGSKLLLNADDDMLKKVIAEKQEYNVEIITYGFLEDADYSVKIVEVSEEEQSMKICLNGKEEYKIGDIGRHIAYNMLIAIIVAKIMGLTKEEIQKGIDGIEKEDRRLKKIEIAGMDVYDDTYNSSYESVKAAVEMLNIIEISGRVVYILGDIFELDDFSEEYHRKVGRLLKNTKIDLLITAGDNSKYINEELSKYKDVENYHFKDNNEVIQNLNLLKEGDTVLVKASNGMNFNKIVDAIRKMGNK